MDLCLYTFTALNDGKKKKKSLPKCHKWQVHSQSAMLGEEEGGVKQSVV